MEDATQGTFCNGNLHTSKLLQSSLCSILHLIKIKNTGCLQKYFVSLKWKIFGTPRISLGLFLSYLSNFAISIRYRGYCIWLMRQNEWYTLVYPSITDGVLLVIGMVMASCSWPLSYPGHHRQADCHSCPHSSWIWKPKFR